jgi:hypothetical protein
MSGEQDLQLVAMRRHGRIEASRDKHADGLTRMRLQLKKPKLNKSYIALNRTNVLAR